ncbi:thiamine transport system permease protein [Deinobacterium chartae]|uniref:Thiamine transport system permease protein n=1 Tax=Deinobacterium chartae TaxID=521158 RepID=A0A841HUU7_9DEIO|nr:iron ABC transporter permease [Deinobacterium chartae]MBB6097137.1 thiamine transport system permease protein [Deinobacterium chartae]
MKTSRAAWGLALLPLAFLTAFLALPLLAALLEGLRGGWRAPLAVLSDPYFAGRLGWTLAQALITTAATLLLGVPAAAALARYDFPGKAALLRALLIPFVVPTLVAALGLLALFGPHGLSGLNLQGSAALVLLANLFYNLALVVRLTHGALRRLPPSVLEAARTLGSSRLRALWRVALPLALPGILAAASLVFLYSFASFGIPLVLGGQAYATLEVEIYTLTAFELRLGEAGALVLVQLGVTALATLLYTALQRRSATAGSAVGRPLPRPRGRQWLEVGFWSALVALVSLAPLAAVLWRSVWGPDGPTLAYWAGLLSADADIPLGLALRNTLLFASVTAAAASVLGGLQALAVWRTRSRVLDNLSLLPLMVSPVSLAVGYLLLYPALRASLALLLAAYALLAYPLVTRSLLPALRALSPSLLGAARTLGSSRGRALRRVVLPLVAPALRTGAALSLATALGEFAATLVLTRPEWATLSVAIYERLGRPGGQNYGEAMAAAGLLMGLTALLFALLERGEGEF